jgi:glycosyltransferase involved in cell wall biosynthesis
VFTPVDLHFLREDREAALAGRRARSDATREREIACVAAADATIVYSEHELSLLAAEVAPDRLHLLRYITRVRETWPPYAGRRDIAFVGNFRHPPNVDGVLWFAREILPLVWRRLPGLVFHVVGDGAPAAVLALAEPRVIVHGWVEALTALLDTMRLTVAPLRYGAGFKGKVAASLAHGVPVIGTSIAIEGTGLLAGDGVAIADTAEDFSVSLMSLYETEAIWTAHAARGIERCRALYAPEAARRVWRDLLARLGLPFRP